MPPPPPPPPPLAAGSQETPLQITPQGQVRPTRRTARPHSAERSAAPSTRGTAGDARPAHGAARQASARRAAVAAGAVPTVASPRFLDDLALYAGHVPGTAARPAARRHSRGASHGSHAPAPPPLHPVPAAAPRLQETPPPSAQAHAHAVHHPHRHAGSPYPSGAAADYAYALGLPSQSPSQSHSQSFTQPSGAPDTDTSLEHESVSGRHGYAGFMEDEDEDGTDGLSYALSSSLDGGGGPSGVHDFVAAGLLPGGDAGDDAADAAVAAMDDRDLIDRGGLLTTAEVDAAAAAAAATTARSGSAAAAAATTADLRPVRLRSFLTPHVLSVLCLIDHYCREGALPVRVPPGDPYGTMDPDERAAQEADTAARRRVATQERLVLLRCLRDPPATWLEPDLPTWITGLDAEAPRLAQALAIYWASLAHQNAISDFLGCLEDLLDVDGDGAVQNPLVLAETVALDALAASPAQMAALVEQPPESAEGAGGVMPPYQRPPCHALHPESPMGAFVRMALTERETQHLDGFATCCRDAALARRALMLHLSKTDARRAPPSPAALPSRSSSPPPPPPPPPVKESLLPLRFTQLQRLERYVDGVIHQLSAAGTRVRPGVRQVSTLEAGMDGVAVTAARRQATCPTWQVADDLRRLTRLTTPPTRRSDPAAAAAPMPFTADGVLPQLAFLRATIYRAQLDFSAAERAIRHFYDGPMRQALVSGMPGAGAGGHAAAATAGGGGGDGGGAGASGRLDAPRLIASHREAQLHEQRLTRAAQFLADDARRRRRDRRRQRAAAMGAPLPPSDAADADGMISDTDSVFWDDEIWLRERQHLYPADGHGRDGGDEDDGLDPSDDSDADDADAAAARAGPGAPPPGRRRVRKRRDPWATLTAQTRRSTAFAALFHLGRLHMDAGAWADAGRAFAESTHFAQEQRHAGAFAAALYWRDAAALMGDLAAAVRGGGARDPVAGPTSGRARRDGHGAAQAAAAAAAATADGGGAATDAMTGTDYVLDAHDDASAAWLGTLPPVVVPFGPARLMELAYTVTARMAHLSPREAWALMLDHSLLAASLAVLGVLGNPGAAAPSAGPWDAAAASAAAGDAAALRLDAAESGGAAAMSPMTDFGAHGWDSADGAVASQTTHVQVSLDFAATILRQYGPPQNPADIEGQRQRLEGLTATWHYLQGEALILTEDSVAAAADHATADLGHATEGLVPWCLRRLQQRDREGALLGAHHDGHARYPRGHRGRPGDHPHSHPHPHLQPHRDRRTRAYVAALASDVLQLDHVLAHVLLPPADRHLVRVVRLVLRMTLIAYRDLADPDDPSRRARRTGFGEDLLATEDVLPDDLTSSTKTASTTATPNQAHDAWPPAPLDSQTLHTDGDAPVSPACPSAGASSPDEDDDQPPWDEDAATSRGSLTDEDDEDDTIALPASLAWQELVGLVTCHHAAHELVHPLSGALLWRALADVLGEGARPGQTFRMATVPDVAAVAQRLWRRSFCARGKLLYRAALAATALATAPPRPCFSPTRAPAAPPLLSTAVAVMLATLPALADQARAMGWAEAALAADVALAEAYVLAGVWPPSPPCGPPRHRAGVPLRALIAHPRWAPIAVRAQRAGRRDYVMRLLAACGAVAARSE